LHITEISIKRPAMMTMVILVFVVLGLFTYGRIKTELFPAINIPYVSVSVSYSGAGAEEIESQIVKPIEDALASVSKLKHITSTASAGRANVTLEFDLSADADKAALDVEKKVNGIQGRLPDGASDPVVDKRDMNDMPVINLALSGNRSPVELYDLADDVISDRLRRLDGVADVSISGGLQREVQINVNKSKLEGFGLSLNQVINRLEAENLNDPSGRMDRPEAEYNIRVLGQFKSVDEIGEILITTSSGYSVPLKEIASVVAGYQEQRQYSRLNGQDAIAIRISKQSDSSVVDVGNAVNKEMVNIKKDLPEGVSLIVANDQSDYVKKSVNGTVKSIIEGIITTALILFIFLRKWQSTFIVMLAIPSSMLATVMMMYFAGYSFNMMSLMGLALCIGILVDDSIVVLENIDRHLRMGKSPWQAAIEGRREIGMAAVAITLSDVVVFTPIAFMQGMVGQFFRQFGMTVVFATLFSLFISFTLTPMAASRLFKQIGPEEDTGRKSIFAFLWNYTIPLGAKIKASYHQFLLWTLSHRKRVLAFALLAFILSLSLIPLKIVGTEFTPQSDEGALTVSVELPIGVPAQKTDAALKQIEDYLKTIPEIKYYQTASGGARGTSAGANTGRISVQLYPKAERERTVWQVSDAIRQWGRGFKGGTGRVSEQSSMGGGGGGGAVQIQISGNDPVQLVKLTEQIQSLVAGVPGTRDANTNWRMGQPEVQITPDHRRTAFYGLSIDDVATTVRTAVNGTTAGEFRDGIRETDIVVRLDQFNKQDISSLENLMISGSGSYVPLGQLASITKGSGPIDIRRTDRQRTITVSSGVVGRPTGDVLNDIKAQMATIAIPQGFYINFAGQDQMMKESFADLISALILSIILVYMVLVMLYESFSTPFIRMLSLPLGIVGALAALAIFRLNINVFTMIGIIMLDGLVAKNGTLLIDYTHTLMERGLPLREALIEAGMTRLKPIIMTTVTMIFGMLPTALALTEGAENRSGMAWVLIGGLITSTVFTLFVIPIVYTIFDEWKTKWRNGRSRQNNPLEEANPVV